MLSENGNRLQLLSGLDVTACAIQWVARIECIGQRREANQREYWLNEQMKVIQKELGEKEGKSELVRFGLGLLKIWKMLLKYIKTLNSLN